MAATRTTVVILATLAAPTNAHANGEVHVQGSVGLTSYGDDEGGPKGAARLAAGGAARPAGRTHLWFHGSLERTTHLPDEDGDHDSLTTITAAVGPELRGCGRFVCGVLGLDLIGGAWSWNLTPEYGRWSSHDGVVRGVGTHGSVDIHTRDDHRGLGLRLQTSARWMYLTGGDPAVARLNPIRGSSTEWVFGFGLTVGW